MSKQLTLVASALFTIILIGCGGDTETSSTPASSSVEASGRGGGETAMADKEKMEKEAEESTGSSDSAANEVAATESSGSATNGLFPNMAMEGGMASGGDMAFGGGLFPEFQASDEGMSDVATNVKEMDETTSAGAGEETKEMSEEMSMSKEMAAGEGGADSAAAGMASKPAPPSMLPKAMKMFTEHADQAAIDVIYANYLVSDSAREQYGLDWYPGLKEPRMLFRWGVGIIFNKPGDLAGRHPVIGDPGDPDEGVDESDRPRGGNRGGGLGGVNNGFLSGGGGGSRGSRTYQNVDTSRPDGYLMYYTGDFGEQLISFLDSRRQDDQPYYGQILKDVMEQKMESEAGEQVAANNSNESAARSAQNTAAPSLGGPPSRGGGVGGIRSQNTRRSRQNNNQPLQREDTSVLDRAMGQAVATKPSDDASGSILPGVKLLGVGSKVDIIERAKDANVDGLLVFSVKISKSRGANSRNRTSAPPEYSCATGLKIIDIASGDNLFSSKMLKDTKVKEENDEGEDPVMQQVERAFATVADEKFRAQELPSGLNEDVIKKRVGKILKNKKDQPLAAAVEIISYHQSELLSTELAETAVTRLFGSEGAKVLVQGDASARVEFLKSALPDVGDNF